MENPIHFPKSFTAHCSLLTAHRLLLTAYILYVTTKSLQVSLCLLIKGTLRIIGDQSRKINAPILAQFLGVLIFCLLFFFRLNVRWYFILVFLLAAILRQSQATFTGNVENFIHPREIRIACVNFLTAFKSRKVCFLQLEIVPSHLQVVQRIFFQVRVSNCRGIRTSLRLSLAKRSRSKNKQRRQKHYQRDKTFLHKSPFNPV